MTKERLIVSLLFPIVLPVMLLLWLALGLCSMRSLSAVMIKTGENLKSYDW